MIYFTTGRVTEELWVYGKEQDKFFGQQLGPTNIKLQLKSNLRLKSNVETKKATFGVGGGGGNA